MPRRKKILVVDDDPADLAIAARILRTPKPVRYELVQAESVAEACSTLRVSAVDLVILDLNLARTRGAETVRRLRLGCRTIPIVVVTGDDAEETGLACIDAGADDFLTKESMAPHLARVVEAALRRNDPRRAPSNPDLHTLLQQATSGVDRPTASPRLDSQVHRASATLSASSGDLQSELRELAQLLVQDTARPMDLFNGMFQSELDNEPEGALPASLRIGLLAVHMAQAYYERLEQLESSQEEETS